MSGLSLIIPAAGAGLRLGTDVPKPFIKVGGKAIIEHTLDKFVDIPGLKQIIVVTSAQYISAARRIVEKYFHTDIQFSVTEGGMERQESIKKALDHIIDDVALIAVHDAVRPFVDPQHIMQCSRIALQTGGAVLGIPSKDTIKVADADHTITSTPDRSMLWQVQTPQVFRKDLLFEAYDKADADGFLGTDDSSLVERLGVKVKMVEGDMKNFKITYPIDLKMAAMLLGERE